GRTMPTEDDLELWCFHCRVQNELPDLIATARSIEKMYAEIKRLMRTGTARYQQELLEEYTKSRRSRNFQVGLIAGPLQTRDYATAILTDAAAMLGHPADIEPTVAARQERAKLMLSGDKLFDFVMLESALRTRVASPEVMRGQLRHLLGVMSLPRV